MKKKPKVIEWSGNPVTVVPFRMNRKLIVVAVEVNGEESCNFIFDTGAPEVILNQAYFQKEEDLIIPNLDFYGNKIRQQLLTTMDLSALEQPMNSTLHGIIGKELFGAYDVLFNYEKKTITLIQPGYFQEYEQGEMGLERESVLPLKQRDHLELITVEVEGEPLNIAIDSGTEVNLIDESYFDLFKPKINLRKLKLNRMIGLDNLPAIQKKAPVQELLIGGILFTNQQTMFGNYAQWKTEGKLRMDGLIGFEVLSQQPTLLSYARKEIIFYRNVD